MITQKLTPYIDGDITNIEPLVNLVQTICDEKKYFVHKFTSTLIKSISKDESEDLEYLYSDLFDKLGVVISSINNRVIINTKNGLLKIFLLKGITENFNIFELDIYTDTIRNSKEIENFIYNTLDDFIIKENTMAITWGSSFREINISQPIPKVSNLDVCYPRIKKHEEYVKSYLNSECPILFLFGPPGTGKTTFIKYLLDVYCETTKTKKVNVKFSTPDALSDDNILMNFLMGNDKFIILEDADQAIEARELGNTKIIPKLLNVSSGVFLNNKKKMIFTSNSPESNVDAALLRYGRSFDKLYFNRFNKDESMSFLNRYIDCKDKCEELLLNKFNELDYQQKNKVGFGFTTTTTYDFSLAELDSIVKQYSPIH